MSKKNHNNSECAFAELVVSYLYDEIDAGNKAAFDAHLPNCPACSGELAGLNFAHISVLDWKTAEFTSLANPKIEIPFDIVLTPPETIVVSKKARPWFFEIGKIFKQSTAWASAFAVLLVFAGLIIFVFDFTKNDQTVSVENQKLPTADASLVPENESEISQSIEPKNDEKEVSNTDSDASSRTDSKEFTAKAFSTESVKEKVVKSPTKPPRQSTNTKAAMPIVKNDASARKIYNSSLMAKTSLPGTKTPKLTLTAEEEDEELSLRLTDLLEEVGGK